MGLLRAKSAGGEGRDPDFAFHEDVLINNDRIRPVDTPTTRAREVEIERVHVLATQCRQRGRYRQHIGRKPFSDS